MVAHIVCGGPDLWLPEALDGFIIGVDRGGLELINRNISFDVAVGDFDSVTENEFRLIENSVKCVVKLPSKKDINDCEAAVVHAVAQGYQEIHLYGATGGRLDHFYATFPLMKKYLQRKIQLVVINEQNKMFALSPVDGFDIRVEDKKYLSFFALGCCVKALTIKNAKYPLVKYDLEVDDTLCLSNEAIGDLVQISFDAGVLLVIQSAD